MSWLKEKAFIEMTESTDGVALAKYDAMRHAAIAEVHAIDEVRGIRDRPVALETYAKRANNFELRQRAAEI